MHSDITLRPCSFCAHEKPVLAEVAKDSTKRIAIVCPECGAVGPMAMADDRPGHEKCLWNRRFGSDC